MGIYQDSDYVQNMARKSINNCQEHMAYQRFCEQYKGRVEQGMTKSDFINEAHPYKEDLAMFERLANEVGNEKELGEAFLKGFQSVPTRF
jgi:hypothetical protein